MGDLSRVRVSGSLLPYAEGFAAWLTERGYASTTVLFHARLLANLSRWMQAEGLAVSELGLAAVDGFLTGRAAVGHLARLRRGSLQPLLEYLRPREWSRSPNRQPATTSGSGLPSSVNWRRSCRSLRMLASTWVLPRVENLRVARCARVSAGATVPAPVAGTLMHPVRVHQPTAYPAEHQPSQHVVAAFRRPGPARCAPSVPARTAPR